MLELALLLPLFGFLVLLMWPRPAGMIACSTVFIAFLIFVHFLYYGVEKVVPLYTWVDLPGMKTHFSLHLDHLSLLMALIITGVGFLIHLYSIGYMEHEKDLSRYFACMNFFIFSMLLLVLAGDLVLLFIGWEGVGLASYLLIGFFYERKEAAAAATKAFVMNRIGDFGLLLALIMILTLFETSEIAQVISQASLGTPFLLTVLTLLLFIGAMGKSAQLPLSTWLPDAMEGPTPVSALIHAATMVTAGIYLVVRFYPLFLLAPWTLNFIGVVGAVTALWAAFSAMGQSDLKRVLAYSTVSQLGLMFVACGAGAFYAAMFHLTTHAFVKALLFLSAGNVVHMTGTTDMNKMGGLAKSLPITHILFLIGVLALSGIPPLANFFSKDLIIEQEHLSGHDRLFVMAVLVSILTAFYLTRAYILTFLGEKRTTAEEAPWIMWGPTSLLAVLGIAGGLLGLGLESFLSLIKLTPAEESLDSGFVITPETWIAVGGTLLGLSAAFMLRKLKVWSFFQKAFYLDALYERWFVIPLKSLSNAFSRWLEPVFFEGSLDWASYGSNQVGARLEKIESGQIRSYVAWMALGGAFLLVYFMGYLK